MLAPGSARPDPVAPDPAAILLAHYLLDDIAAAEITVEKGVQGKDPAPDGTFFQPFWHSDAPKPLLKYHRRVLLHDRSDAFRDMREALVLPVPSKAVFPLCSAPASGSVSKQPDEFGRRCIPSGFVALPRHTPGMTRHRALSAGCLDVLGSIGLFLDGPSAGTTRKAPVLDLVFSAVPLQVGGKGRAAALVRCLGTGKDEVLWQQEMDGSDPGKVLAWPEPVAVTLPAWCERVSLEAAKPATGAAGGVRLVWESPRVERRVSAERQPKYNVIYVVVDALRSDVVGVHRTDFPSVTPAMDALEKSGTTFPNGFANGNTTLLSMNAMLLGAHPRAMSFLATWWGGRDRRADFYALKPPYLGRLLHRAGYLAYGAVHNHLFFPGYIYGIDPGFDILQDCGRDTTDHTILTDRTIEFMRRHRDRRFFIELNLLGPHQPYAPPAEFLESVKKTIGKEKPLQDLRYLGETAWVDLHVEKLVAALDELGLRASTLIILTSDHGEVMDQSHSCFSEREQHACFHLHGLTLYDEEINVPMIFSLPGVVKAGQVAPDFAQHADLVPTILDLLGLPADPRMSGRSLAPVLTAGERLEDVPIYSERWLVRAYRKGKYKLILHSAKDDICPPCAARVCKEGEWYELYDLEADPRERSEISRQHPEIAKELKQGLLKFKAWLYEKSGKVGPNP